MRSEEGYMAEVEPQDDGSILLTQRHCPRCKAAGSCQELCSIEPDVFQEVLGSNISVERIEHIQSGDACCSYRIHGSSAPCQTSKD